MEWTQVLGVLKDFGIAGVFAMFWWLERQERLDDKKIDETRAQARDAALNEVRLALTALSTILDSRPK